MRTVGCENDDAIDVSLLVCSVAGSVEDAKWGVGVVRKIVEE